MSRPFRAIFPQTIRDGDKILLKGLLKDDAYEFSINFVYGTNPYPDDVAYHFKTIVPENLIVENRKVDGEWLNETVKDWPCNDGPDFAFEFAFTGGNIYTYSIEGPDIRNLITFYKNESNLSKIESIQAWGDVDRVQEITFLYA